MVILPVRAITSSTVPTVSLSCLIGALKELQLAANEQSADTSGASVFRVAYWKGPLSLGLVVVVVDHGQ